MNREEQFELRQVLDQFSESEEETVPGKQHQIQAKWSILKDYALPVHNMNGTN